MDNILHIYYEKVSKFPLLSRDQEFHLIKKAQEGDECALTLLISSNLRLVISIAQKYKSLNLLDCISIGNFGLFKSVSEFDLDKGFKFSTYATWWIHKSIKEYLYYHRDLIKQPTHFYKLKKALNTFISEKQAHPTIEQLSEQTGLERKTIVAALDTLIIFSLDAPLEGDNYTHHEITSNPETEEIPDFDIDFLFSRTQVTDKEKATIILYFGFDEGGYQRTLKEVGEILGVSTERARQLKEQGLQKLKKAFLRSEKGKL